MVLVLQETGTNDPVSNGLKDAILGRFTGQDYKRKLETKLRGLKITKDTNINLFVNTLRNTVKELYGLQEDNKNAVDCIAIHHVVMSFSNELKFQAKILQLTGSKSLECLLELVKVKLMGYPMFVNASSFRYFQFTN